MKFGEVISTVRPAGDAWSAHIPLDWGNGRTVFGGLQAALLVRGMRGVLGEARTLPLRSLHVTFVAPVAAGDGEDGAGSTGRIPSGPPTSRDPMRIPATMTATGWLTGG